MRSTRRCPKRLAVYRTLDHRSSQVLLLLLLRLKLERLRPHHGTFTPLQSLQHALCESDPLRSSSSVPAALKHAEATSKATTTQAKTVDMWAPLPTPVPMSSSRSFSELMKSEENLSSRVAQLQALVEQQQQALAVKDSEIRSLKSEVVNGQEMIAKTHRSWESKSEALLSQQQEKYQDLNDRYLVLLSRTRACESKLEEMFIDPLTLQPFHAKVAEQTQAESALQRQRTILSIIEEHQHKEDTHIIEIQKETEANLRRAVEELAPKLAVHELIAAARDRGHVTDLQLRQVELSIPSLIIDERPVAEDDDESAEVASDLDWSIMSADESGTSQLDSVEQNIVEHVFSPSFHAMEDDNNPSGLDDSSFDDDFFNESVIEEN